MEFQTDNWLQDFLSRRDLSRPDKLALYAYRCSQEEFDSLGSRLERTPSHIRLTEDAAVRAFVLYASEWWQRKYEGCTVRSK